MFILCNDTLDLDGKDRGLARRIRKINFASQFTEIKEPDLQNHTYPINVDMSDMVQVWAPELMVLLLERVSPDYVYTCPSSIQQGSEEYMQENDPVRRFVQDNLQKDADSLVEFVELRGLPWNDKEYGSRPKLAEGADARSLVTTARQKTGGRDVSTKASLLDSK